MGRLEYLTKIRKEKKMSVTELARLAETSEANMSRYETGRRKLPVETAKKIAAILDIEWWKLYE